MNVYCDGSALPYANCGGWAWVRDDEASRAAAVRGLGSNQAELFAVVEAISTNPGPLVVHTDSKYVLCGVRSRKATGTLWEELYLWLEIKDVSIVKIKTHPLHTKAHHLARSAVFNLLAG